MKYLFTSLFLILSGPIFSQYRIDSTVKNEYRNAFQRLTSYSDDEIKTEFPRGLAILYTEITDTLNKEDIIPGLYDIKLDAPIDSNQINNVSGANPTTPEDDAKKEPFLLSCACSFKNNTLSITSGYYLFSGFTIAVRLRNNSAKVLYSEVESDRKVLQTKLTEEKSHGITIPAEITLLVLDRSPTKYHSELYGKMGITTAGYYSYINVWGFKSEYIHKRMHYEFYFHCDTKGSVPH